MPMIAISKVRFRGISWFISDRQLTTKKEKGTDGIEKSGIYSAWSQYLIVSFFVLNLYFVLCIIVRKKSVSNFKTCYLWNFNSEKVPSLEHYTGAAGEGFIFSVSKVKKIVIRHFQIFMQASIICCENVGTAAA